MTKTEILAELYRLPAPEQLLIVESLANQLRQRLEIGSSNPPAGRALATAAQALLSDYESDAELTAFTALDGEPLHETR